MALPNKSKIPVGTVLAGKYRITREIGRGGMAAVYEAENVDIGKRVAVKVLAAGADDLGRSWSSASSARPAPPPPSAARTSATSTTPASSTTAGRSWCWSCSRASRSTSG